MAAARQFIASFCRTWIGTMHARTVMGSTHIANSSTALGCKKRQFAPKHLIWNIFIDAINDGGRPAAQPTNRCADDPAGQTELPERFASDPAFSSRRTPRPFQHWHCCVPTAPLDAVLTQQVSHRASLTQTWAHRGVDDQLRKPFVLAQ